MTHPVSTLTEYLYDALFYVYARGLCGTPGRNAWSGLQGDATSSLPGAGRDDARAVDRQRVQGVSVPGGPDLCIRAKQAKRDLYAFLFHVYSGT